MRSFPPLAIEFKAQLHILVLSLSSIAVCTRRLTGATPTIYPPLPAPLTRPTAHAHSEPRIPLFPLTSNCTPYTYPPSKITSGMRPKTNETVQSVMSLLEIITAANSTFYQRGLFPSTFFAVVNVPAWYGQTDYRQNR